MQPKRGPQDLTVGGQNLELHFKAEKSVRGCWAARCSRYILKEEMKPRMSASSKINLLIYNGKTAHQNRKESV